MGLNELAFPGYMTTSKQESNLLRQHATQRGLVTVRWVALGAAR